MVSLVAQSPAVVSVNPPHYTHTEEGAEPSCPLGLREGLPSRQDSLAPGSGLLLAPNV